MRVQAMVLMTALLPTALPGQSDAPLLEGPRAWVRQTTDRNFLDRGLKGSVVRIAADTIFVRPKGRREPIPLLMTERTRFQLPQGTTRGTGRGTRLGAAVGAGTGLVLLMVAGGASGAAGGGPSGGGIVVISALFGLLGAGVGAVAGAASTVESWSPPMTLMGAMPTFSRVPGAQ